MTLFDVECVQGVSRGVLTEICCSQMRSLDDVSNDNRNVFEQQCVKFSAKYQFCKNSINSFTLVLITFHQTIEIIDKKNRDFSGAHI